LQEGKPREELDHGQLLHRLRHLASACRHLLQSGLNPGTLALSLQKRGQVLRRILLGANHRPQDRPEEGSRPGVEGVQHRRRVGEFSDPDSSTNGYAPVSTPSPEELETAGLTIQTPDRPTRIDGSLRDFRDRLREVKHADSLAARLQRQGLVPAHGLRPDGPPPSPDSVSIDVFPANLYGDPLREAIVQVRAGGRTYSLSFFEAVPGGWERHPGLVHVNAPASVDGCPGGFCFELAEARAEGEMLLST